jgi:cell division protein FtsB
MFRLNEKQLRFVADYLYDGEPIVLHLMAQIRNFNRGDEVLIWFMKNHIRGKNFINFFKEQSNDEKNMGVILGVQKVLSSIDRENLFEKQKVKKLYSKDLI